MRVLGRTRPTDHFSASVQLRDDNKTIQLHTNRKSSNDVINNSNEDCAYKLDGILRDASQEMVYDIAGADLVKSTLSGVNGTLMCYGQTGAGKTFTLMGGSEYRTRGCIPRCIKGIFDEAQQQPDKTFDISVSFLEIYNDRIRDLLHPNSDEDLMVQEDNKGAVTVRGLEQRVCTKESDALALLFEGNINRQTSEHNLNQNSSRSHVVFTIYVQSRSRVESESASVVSKLHCIDLAGSERLSKTGSDGKTAKEAQYINKSLTFLEQVVMALGNTNRSHIPYRQSKLTSLLKDSLGGNSRTTMIANLWPEDQHMEETTSTLKFAVRMMRVQTEPQVNTVTDSATQIRLLQRQIAELKSELQMQNQLVGKSHVQYEGDFGEDERFEMEKTVLAYVNGGAQAAQQGIPVKSLREVKEYFKIFKTLIDQRDAEIRAGGGGTAGNTRLGTAAGIPAATGGATSQSAGGGVGTVDKTSGFSIGVAAPSKNLKDVLKSAPPGTSGLNPYGTSLSAARDPSVRNANDGDVSSYTNQQNSSADVPDKNTAFVEFKRGPGAKLANMIKHSQDELTEAKRQATELGHTVNAVKSDIDGLMGDLTHLRNERLSRGDDDVVDQRETQLVEAVKTARTQYRAKFDELSTTKAHRDQLARTVEAARRRLVEEFDSWYQRQLDAAGISATSSPLKARPPAGGGRSYGSGAAAEDDELDEGERFEALELNRVLEGDPESVAFYTAKKMASQKQAAQRSQMFQRGATRK